MSEGKLALVSLLVIAMGCSSAPPGGGGYSYAADGVAGSDGVAGADGTVGSDTAGGGATDAGGGSVDSGGTGGGAADSGGGKPDSGGGGGGTVPNIAPGCADGTMTGEVPPTADASIQDLVAGYSSEKAYEFVLDVLDRRYPTGAFLIEQGVAKAQQNCFELFLPAALRGNVKQVIDRIEVLVHECGHLYDLSQGGFSGSHYHIFDGVTRTCSGGKHTGPNKTIARSLLNTDAYSAKRPPCKSGNKGSHGCDSYADIYLDGDPT
ncbi:MAG: hypothetical protein H6747_16795, partial [Deltaproteobacteria bacterium]|nr:hypothetical protein [Deltaproteobacteria bacterium]